MKPSDMNNTSAAEIDTKIVELEKELKTCIGSHEVVEQEKLLLQREILNLQVRKKDLEISLSKSMSNIKQLTISLRILRSHFWSARNSGI